MYIMPVEFEERIVYFAQCSYREGKKKTNLL